MKISIFKNRTLSREARRELRPGKASIKRGRERFLAAFDASTIAAGARIPAAGNALHPRAALFAKFAIGILAVLCIATGVSVYADTANVPVTSPLYPWKRLGENVQLALTASAEQKAQLQATFAVRRAEELQTLAAVHPSSTMIPGLTKDLNEDISSSLSTVVPAAGEGVGAGFGHERGSSRGAHQNGSGGVGSGAEISSSPPAAAGTTTFEGSVSESVSTGGGPLGIYCAAFDSSVSGVLIGHLEESLAAHPGAFAEFNRRCGGNAGDAGGVGGAGGVEGAATATIQQDQQQPAAQTQLFQQLQQSQPQGYQSSQQDGGSANTNTGTNTNTNTNTNTGAGGRGDGAPAGDH